MASVHEKYAEKGLVVVGIHAPEFDRERDPGTVRRYVRDLEIRYPVVLDNDFRMWDALENRYWPSLYLVDTSGTIRRLHTGEMHEGTPAARDFEAALLRHLPPAPRPEKSR